jgi:hypothetical protein
MLISHANVILKSKFIVNCTGSNSDLKVSLLLIVQAQTVGQPAWQESSKVKSQSRDFRFIFDEKWRSTLRLKYVGLQ